MKHIPIIGPIPGDPFLASIERLTAMNSAWDRMAEAALARDDAAFETAKADFHRINREAVRANNAPATYS